ncbi:anaerobic ribonucleoside-triphosphate reductase activating protein [Sphingobacterium corticibacterium]|uniref:Anaerobic ribonucleoside-triphosphate reductase activating protein n=1 Tax=Sphingobacterium corticibacterium TaxID=2484746 RepID=A0A4Q6XQX8_9SPHI|nr:anaerobic ribonucleoside-triphosphate reductase activating protein [Sphingobacterium corticibacterium]RZF62753.1 anaerobic ribonucleoside-triphosphate reductase activating protein [Sphingobacterium corticibacterium]
MIKPIYSITPFTLLDYPDHPACILWFAGCNMRCLYCYNPDIVLGKGKLSVENARDFLQSRKSLLQGVVFSGGECTLHPSLIPLARIAKELGYRIKVDTNGSQPYILEQLWQEGLLDYVALDFKGIGQKHRNITLSDTFASFANSLTVLQKKAIPFEVRTTWHANLLSVEDMDTMVTYLEQQGYEGKYFIQYFRNGVKTLSPLPYTNSRLDPIRLSTEKIKVEIRTT